MLSFQKPTPLPGRLGQCSCAPKPDLPPNAPRQAPNPQLDWHADWPLTLELLQLLCESCIFLLLFLSKPSDSRDAVLSWPLYLPDIARVRVREPDTTRTSWVKLMRGLMRTIGRRTNSDLTSMGSCTAPGGLGVGDESNG